MKLPILAGLCALPFWLAIAHWLGQAWQQMPGWP